METALLLPAEFEVLDTCVHEDSITVCLDFASNIGYCPLCHSSSSHLHSHYQRKVGDLPISGKSVSLKLCSRKFFCDQQYCPRKKFAQQVPEQLQPYARRVERANQQVLAIGLEMGSKPSVKQDNGHVILFDTETFALLKQVPVGALPDMVTFSPDGAYLLSANEGEPNSDYTVDPKGTVSIISIADNFNVVTLDFISFNHSQAELEAKGFRVFGPNATLAMDVEPESITVSDDSKTAWVSLQENNAMAKVDLVSKSITEIVPLGFKDHAAMGKELDPSDEDNAIAFANWPVKGIYMPDALAAFSVNGTDYVISANEGDAREYDGFQEEERIKNLMLDPGAFPNAAQLQQDENLGRLKATATMGDTDRDGDYDALYTFGARSFSIWHGATGTQIYDSGSDIGKRLAAATLYPDDRSDDKGAEPEGVAVGVVNGRTIAFVGAERADAVLVFDVTNPSQPAFLQLLKTGDAPEGIIFIPVDESPVKKSLLVVSSENDGVVKIFEAGTLL